MTKKIISIFIIVLCLFSITTVEAASVSNFIDLQAYENVYKLSEDSDIELPFIKVFNQKANFDKKLSKSGILIGSQSIEITDEVKGIQFIIGADTVDIKGSMEYAVILASNVVISGNIEKDILILAESVFITDTANIGGDIITMANTVELKGTVLGSYIANSTEFLMSGNVGKDFRVCSENMTFDETDIKGDIYVETNSELGIFEQYTNAVVNKIQTNVVSEAERRDQRVQTTVKVITAVILFTLLNIIVKKIKPEIFVNLTNKLKGHSTYAIIGGVLVLTTIPIVTVLALLASMFGIGVVTTPLFVIYIAILVVAIALAKFITGSVIYEFVKEKIKINTKLKETGALLAIFALIHILCYVPYIAWFMTMATVLFSTGIILTGITRKQ